MYAKFQDQKIHRKKVIQNLPTLVAVEISKIHRIRSISFQQKIQKFYSTNVNILFEINAKGIFNINFQVYNKNIRDSISRSYHMDGI